MTNQFKELTDSQWDAISPFFNLKRKRKLDLRDILSAIFYLLRTGCQWRNLPSYFPAWRAVNYYFELWKKDGTFEKINVALNSLDRIREKKEAHPSLLCIDSQSVKLAPMIFENRGIDAYKNGRKRHLLARTDGRVWAARVGAAHKADGYEGCHLLKEKKEWQSRLKTILGDGAYGGIFAKMAEKRGLVFERASRAESSKGFVPIAKRWVVERSIAWTNFFRRLVKDYEYTVESSAVWFFLANINLMLQRIYT